VAGDGISDGADSVIGGIRIDVGMEEEQIHTLEFLTIHRRLSRQFEHTVEADGRVIRAGLLADETGPHGVVQFGVGMGHGGNWWGSGYEIMALPGSAIPEENFYPSVAVMASWRTRRRPSGVSHGLGPAHRPAAGQKS